MPVLCFLRIAQVYTNRKNHVVGVLALPPAITFTRQ